MEFPLVNTLRVEYSGDQKPHQEDIINFLKELEVDLESLSGFYGSEAENAFFVKLHGHSELKTWNERINNKEYIIIRKQKCSVKSEIKSSFVTELFLHNVPLEILNEEIMKKLKKYGRVKNILWQKCEITEDISVYNGVRICTIEINRAIPPYIYVRNVKIRSFHRYQQSICYKCLSSGHHRNSCNTVVKTTTTLKTIPTHVENIVHSKTNTIDEIQEVLKHQSESLISDDKSMDGFQIVTNRKKIKFQASSSGKIVETPKKRMLIEEAKERFARYQRLAEEFAEKVNAFKREKEEGVIK